MTTHTRVRRNITKLTKLIHLPSPPGSWDINISQTLPKSSKLSQTLPNLIKLSQTLPNSPKFSQTLPNYTKIFNTLPNSSKFSQTLPNSPKISQILPGGGKHFFTFFLRKEKWRSRRGSFITPLRFFESTHNAITLDEKPPITHNVELIGSTTL